MKLTDLKPNPDNPRSIKEDDFEKLKSSIKDLSKMLRLRPIVVDKDNVIVAGNQRYKALLALNKTEIPDEWVAKADDFTKAELRRFIVQDNVESGDWDYDILSNEYELEELDAWGVDLPEYLTEETEVEEDEAPEVDESEPPKSKLGEIYQLGRHRVMCADSTVKVNVEKLMDGVKADMVFTDPPYGMDLDTDYTKMAETKVKSKTYDKVIGDNADYDAGHIFDTFTDCNEIFLWGADWYYNTLPLHGSWIVWDKRNEASDGLTGNHFEMLWSKQRHRRRIIRHLWSGFTARNADTARVHPTEKPTKVLADVIGDYSDQDDTIVDIFLGSGSTLIACEQTDRTCYGMELDPKYVDVIRKRYAKFTNNNELPENWEELTKSGEEQAK